MKHSMIILMALSMCVGLCNATVTVVQDYESYANTLELRAAHTFTANATLSLETITVHSGSKAMKVDFNNGASPYYSQAKYAFPSTVPEDWNGFSELSVWYNVENNAGSAPLKIAIVDIWGGNMYVYTVGVPQAGQGWQEAVIDLHAVLIPDQLNHVGRVDLTMSAGYNGKGTFYFDDITLTPIPEPATLVLLGAGGLLLRRRRK